MELAKAYVQIVPSADGIQGSISRVLGGEAQSAGISAGKSFGGNMVGAIKKVVAAAGIGKIFKDAISEGASLEQSIGGIETLFKDSSDTMKKYASEAYKTAGISANSYMEQSTSFAASLLQSLGGDTKKAAEAANTAIIDMADNSNKMGTSLESIQMAYQGFAKGQYQLLDNLKLGYGGTKTEMERLLSDAQKITGVKYDLNNLSDVYSAIHVIQEELDITGTTAKEATTTLSGSLMQMKASFTNLLGNLALGESIDNDLNALVESVFQFFNNNLIPMIGNVLKSIPTIVSNVISLSISEFDIASKNSSKIVNFAMDLVKNLAQSLISNIPTLLSAALNMISEFANAFLNYDWLSFGNDIIGSLNESMTIAGTSIFGENSVISSFLDSISEKLPDVLDQGVQIVSNLANGVLSNLPALIDSAKGIIQSYIQFLAKYWPSMLQAGADLLANLVHGILNHLPEIVDSVLSIIETILVSIGDNLPSILLAGVEIIGTLGYGLLQAIPKIISAVAQIMVSLLKNILKYDADMVKSGLNLIIKMATGIVNGIPRVANSIVQIISNIKNKFLSTDWLDVGKNIIYGIRDGIVSFAGSLADAAREAAANAVRGVKGFLGISSPSKLFRDEIGAMISKGMAIGIEKNADDVSNAMSYLQDAAIDSVNADMSISSGIVVSGQNTDSTVDILDYLRTELPKLANKSIYLDGDTLVGHTIERIDDELGQLQINNERGVFA